jgi:hypothetical protein
MNRALESHDVETVWYHAEAFLAAASAISYVFWPSRQDPVHTERAAILRQVFGMTDDSPLRARAVRDRFVHYDERLDRYLATGNRVIVDSNITDTPVAQAVVGATALRHFDRSSMTVSFLDQSLDLGELLDAANELRSRLRQFSPTLASMLRDNRVVSSNDIQRR